MKKRISLFFGFFAVVALVMSIVSFAATYKPDKDGLYSVNFECESEGEYFMVVLKGEYDQTNYIEAYIEANESDILYTEYKVSADGSMTFGPFAPKGYFDATVIVGGTSLDEPVIAGYLSAKGVSNTASIKLTGFDNTYTVKGADYADTVIEIKAEVFDSFGYPDVTNENVEFVLEGNDDGVTIEGNVVKISGAAKAQVFSIVATAGTAKENAYVEIKREAPVANKIEVYSDASFETVVEKYIVKGAVGNVPYVTIYARTLDQYNEPLTDTYAYVYNGNSVSASFSPKFGDVVLNIQSKDYSIERNVIVTAIMTQYSGAALELENLIATCTGRLAEKTNISSTGKDVLPEETWTTQASFNAFSEAIETAKSELSKFGTDGYNADYYVSVVEELRKALEEYNASFSAGTKKSIVSMSIKAENAEILPGDRAYITITANPFDHDETISVKSSNESVVTVESYYGDMVVVFAEGSGLATITATTETGITASVDITVIRRATYVSVELTSNTAVYGGEEVVAKVKMTPKNSTDVIEWTYDESLVSLEFVREYSDINNRYLEYAVVINPQSAGGSCYIKADAKYSRKSDEELLTVEMPDWETAKAPVSSVESGSVVSGTKVVLSSATPDAKIYYTLDGKEPTKESSRPYNGPITINQSVVLKAFATGDNLFDSEVVTYTYDVVDTKISVSSAIAKPGSRVAICVNNIGFADIERAEFEIEFDSSVLEYQGFENDTRVSVSASGNKLKVSYSNESGVIADGEFAHIYFDVKENAPEGDYELKVVSAVAKTSDEAVGEAGEFSLAYSNGTITVNNYILGDANDDGKINLADVILTKQYAEGMDSAKNKILVPAADVNADGVVNNDDVTLLSRYCVGWNVEFGK